LCGIENASFLVRKLNKNRRHHMKKVLMFALALLITAAFVTTGFTQDKPAAPAPEKAAAAPEKAKEKAPKAKKAPKEKKEKKEMKKEMEKPMEKPAAPAPAK
jgi:outer membrane biosynthesis protein TonB